MNYIINVFWKELSFCFCIHSDCSSQLALAKNIMKSVFAVTDHDLYDGKPLEKVKKYFYLFLYTFFKNKNLPLVLLSSSYY